ncbi:hypothetical protein BD779DRAFT_1681390 [Infundibulicybe gibba]|nr:hypothetical protein BD779DRAFT_1681390 [Infundibulicybe gibba]
MTPKTWTTPEQAELLGGYLSEYQDISSRRGYRPFWDKVNEAWFSKYPERAVLFPDDADGELSPDDQALLSDAIQATQERIRTWYRWQANNQGRTAEKRNIHLLETLTTSKMRTHHKSEIYLKLYYEERIKPLNKWARRLFKEEDEETKSKVEEERLLEVESLKKASKEASDPHGSTAGIFPRPAPVPVGTRTRGAGAGTAAEAPSGRTAEQYMSAIRDCPSVVGRFLEVIARETGWSFTCILGGPHPEKGEIVASRYGGTFSYPLPTEESLSSYSSGDASQTVSRASTPGTGYGTNMDMPMEPGLGPSYMYGWPQLPYNPVPPQNLAPPYSYGAITGTNWPAFQFSHDPKSSDMAGQQPTPSPSSSFAGDAPGLGGSWGSWGGNDMTNGSGFVNMLNSNVMDFNFLDNAPSAPSALSTGVTSVPTTMIPVVPSAAIGTPGLSESSRATATPTPSASLATTNTAAVSATTDAATGPASTNAATTAPTITNAATTETIITNAAVETSAPFPTLPGAVLSITTLAAEPVPSPDMSDAAPGIPTSPSSVAAETLSPIIAGVTASSTTPPAPPPDVSGAATTAPTSSGPDIAPPIVSRAGCQIVPSSHSEKLNAIGMTNQKDHQPSIPARPTETPEWMTEAREYLVGLDLGDEWKSCVDTWAKLETMVEYSTKTKGVLPEAKTRPEEWSRWTSKGCGSVRLYNLSPELVRSLDVDDFGAAFIKWWHRMQPPFRQGNGLLPVATYSPTKIALETFGNACGREGQMTMLGWWGRKGSLDPGWIAATTDIRRTLEEMMPVGAKRKGEANDKGTGSQKQQKK